MKCKRCGFCCIYADVFLGEVTKENEENLKDKSKWLALHRVDSFFVEKDNKRIMVLRIPQVCVNLNYDRAKGKYHCRDYNNRPATCRTWVCDLMKRSK